ncbi:MAG: NosD domain-containing protein [Candidatus Lokiarchaeota archaeon]
MKNHLKQLIAISLLILSFSVIYIPLNLNSPKNEHVSNYNNPSPPQSLTDSSPIRISSDSDFLSYGFPGTGSKEDPFRIENLVINRLGWARRPDGIRIENVSKSFIIQNCWISASCAIRIISCTSDSIQLINNWCRGGGDVDYLGIFINGINAHSFKAINNTCLDYYNGMYIIDALYSVIENNMLIRNTMGIKVESNISFSKIINNYCMNNYDGMDIWNSNAVLYKNNYFYNNINGFVAYNISNCKIIDNLFDNNTSYAIINTAFLSPNHIYHNTFINNRKNGASQAIEWGKYDLWYNESLKEGNYWSNWFGLGPYHIDGRANFIDLYPLEKPVQATFTKYPFPFLGRIILIISVTSIISVAMIVISEFYLKKRQKHVDTNSQLDEK